MPNARPVLLLALLAAALAGCGEKPQTLAQTERAAASRDQTARDDERRQRTIHQNDANRIYNEGVLR